MKPLKKRAEIFHKCVCVCVCEGVGADGWANSTLFKQAEKLKSREMKEGWMKNDEGWRMKDDDFKLLFFFTPPDLFLQADFKTILDLSIWYRIDWDIQGHSVNFRLAQLLYYVRVLQYLFGLSIFFSKLNFV